MFLILLPCMGHTAIPQKINHQGYLTNAAGVPVNGTVQVVFSIYTVSVGGSALWTETQNVTVTQGVYNVELGGVTPIGLAFDIPYYLGVRVGSDSEMTPRIVLTSVGYAYRAKTVDSVGSHTHSGADITTGTVSEPRIDALIARDSEVTASVNAHATRTDNPHATTAVQVGAAPTVHTHTGGDITTGTIAEARIDSLIARDSEVSAAIASHNHDTRYYDKAYVDALEARIAALEAKLSGLTRSGSDFVISNANLYIQSGSGTTNGTVNGKGNLIIGYNELRGSGDDRTGSHNLIVGGHHNYSSFGGIVVGYENTISGSYSSVSGGVFNTASGFYSSISGGNGNTASLDSSSVSGGTLNNAIGNASSVSGGYQNTASGTYSSVSGGYGNTASGAWSSGSGGRNNRASGFDASVSGGGGNTASGDLSSVSGGYANTASGTNSSVSGGSFRSANGTYDWVAGGLWQDN